MKIVAPFAVCAVNPGATSCSHDAIEPNWDIDLVEETQMEGPFALVTGAYTMAELLRMEWNQLTNLIFDMEDRVTNHIEQMAKRGLAAKTECEVLHLRAYEHDLAVLRAMSVASMAQRSVR